MISNKVKLFTVYVLLFLLLIASPASAATITFTYDALNQLTSVTYDNGQTINYSYDPGGNLTAATNTTTNQLQVTSTDPATGATDVPVDQAIYAVFNNCITPGSSIANISITSGTSVVSYTYSIKQAELFLTPTSNLTPGVAYSVYIPSGSVQDYYGNTLASTYGFSFTTQPAQNTPTLTALNLSGSPSLIYNGAPIIFDLTTLTLNGQDQNGNAYDISGQTVTWAVYSGNANVSGSTLTINGAGQIGLTATIGQVTSGVLTLTVTQAQATPTLTALNLSGSPSLIYNGAPIIFDLTTLTLNGQDQNGNAYDISGQTVTWAVYSGNANVSGSTLTINSDGPVVVTAGIGNITSNPLTLNVTRAAPVLTTLDLSGNPTLTYNGAPLNFNLTALTLAGQDQFGNSFDISGQTVTWAVYSGNATISGSTLTINSAGQVSVTASIGSITSDILGISVGQQPQPPSSDATLGSLTASAGTLAPAFTSSRTSYADTLDYGTTSITVTATVYQSQATLTINGTPVPSGQPSQTISLNVGSNIIKVVVTAQNGTTTKIYTLNAKVKAPVIKVSPTYIPDATAEGSYAETFTASGGIGPYTFTEIGPLPTGLAFSIDTISGTTLATGSYPISITAADVNGYIGARKYILTVKAPTIKLSPGSLPACTAEKAYTETFTASGGIGPYIFTESGTLPQGLVFNIDTISGTTLATGSYSITIAAADADNFIGTKAYILTVSVPTITVKPAILKNATVGKVYKDTISASGGAGPYTFSETGTLPTGLAFSNNILSGTPTAAGTFNITVTATDAGGFTGTTSYVLTVTALAQAVNLTSLKLEVNSVAGGQVQSAASPIQLSVDEPTGTKKEIYTSKKGTGLQAMAQSTPAFYQPIFGIPDFIQEGYWYTIPSIQAIGLPGQGMVYDYGTGNYSTGNRIGIYVGEYYYGYIYPDQFQSFGISSGSLPDGVTYTWTNGDDEWNWGYLELDGTPTTPGNYSATFQAVSSQSVPGTLEVGFTVCPNVINILPMTGSAGDAIEIEGTGFTGATSVLFGNTPASFTVDSDSQITAIVPSGSGTAQVNVVVNGVSSQVLYGVYPYDALSFTYSTVPAVCGLNPASGPSIGGTQVSITGSNFTGTTAVDFGNTAAVGFSVYSDTQITAVSPPGAGTVDVTVYAPGGTSPATSSFTYTYPDQATLGGCSYCLFGRDSVNLSTGNFIHQETDFNIPSLGPPLAFTRFYNSQDDATGPQGRGWTNNLNVNLNISSGGASVTYPDGHVYTFVASSGTSTQPMSAGTVDAAANTSSIKPDTVVAPPPPAAYTAPPGCYETLTGNEDYTYTLTFKDHTKYNFNSEGQLTSIVDKNGNAITLAYNNYNNNLLSTATDSLGRSLTFSYNGNNQLSGITDPIGRTVSYTYDNNGNLSTVTDVNANTTSYRYDAGNANSLTEIAQPNGNIVITNAYDPANQVISQTDGDGNTWQFAYTPSQTTMTGPLNDTTAYTYDNSYRATGLQDALGKTTSYQYTDSANPFLCTQETDPLGNAVSYTYDSNGNMLTYTDSSGATSYTYDGNNNLLSATDPAGRTSSYAYDSNNNLLSTTDASGNKTTYAYTSSGQLQMETNPGAQGSRGTVQGNTTYTYDPVTGQVQSITDPQGVETTYTYDQVSRLLSTTDKSGQTTSYTYDNACHLLSATDPLGDKTGYTYDANGNKTSETNANGNTTHYTYDDDNLLLSQTDPLGDTTQYAYDTEGHLHALTDANGNTITYAYDLDGRRISTTDAIGDTASTSYDAVGNVASTTDGDGTTQYSHDALGNMTGVTDGAGDTTQYNYDQPSQCIKSVTDPNGNTTSYAHDDLNNLIGATDPLNGEAGQSFDPDGNQVALTDPNQNQTSFQYDNADRLTGKALATGATISDTYDNDGRIATVTNARGQVATYQYDNAGRLTSYTDPAGTVAYTYDANGNLLTASDQSGTITRTYDTLNRVTSYTDAQGNTIHYAYDKVGNLTKLTYPDGNQVNYTYDAANRLISVTDWANRITSYQYDNENRLVTTNNPDGSVQTISYDSAGRIAEKKGVDKNGNVIDQYDLTYDKNGNVTQAVVAAPTQPFIPSNAQVGYSSKDNRATTYNGQAISYDADGNMTYGPLSGQMNTYTFDARNRLTQVGDTTYTYDSEGNRTGTVENDTQITYVINPESPLNEALTKTDSSGKTDYVYGLGLIGQQDSTGDYLTYHFDFRGNTVALTGINGSVADQYQYDPYGDVAYHSSSTSTPFLYDGRDGVMLDANGLFYMRARYYDPDTRRFISRDTVTGSLGNPQSLNSYGYALNNPVEYNDPTGNWANTEEQELAFATWSYNDYILGCQISNGWQYGTPVQKEEFNNAMNILRVRNGMGEWFGGIQKYDLGEANKIPLSQDPSYMVISALTGTGEAGEGAAEGVTITEEGLNIVKSHIASFGEDAPNEAMISRLEQALSGGEKLTGADANFYLHELKESELMAQGLPYEVAHEAALEYYGVSRYSLYAKEVVSKFADQFHADYLRYWGL
jgi:RHS repeat-associated protein